MATRRISWIDHGSMTAWHRFCFFFLPWSGVLFLAAADWRDGESPPSGEGEHHQRNVAMPPMPGSALVVIEPELVFAVSKLSSIAHRCLRPPPAFRWMLPLDTRCEEGEIAIGDYDDGSTDRVSKDLDFALFKFFDIEIGHSR